MKKALFWILLPGSLLGLLAWHFMLAAPANKPLRLGVLHALTGDMAVSEAPLVDAIRLAAEEINAQGGLLGHPLELVVVDSRSDDSRVAADAERLFVQEQIRVLFGCWTSSCRKAVKPVVERLDQLMFYSARHEGMEESNNIFYTGDTPNQQLIPGARWAMKMFGKRICLVQSNHLFSQTAHMILQDVITLDGGEILAEHTLAQDTFDAAQLTNELKRHQADLVLNSLVGPVNALFFATLEQNGLADLPVVSLDIAEVELQAWGGTRLHQHYGIWSYFQSLPGEDNRKFVSAFKARYGNDRVTSAPIEAAYVSVLLWANAVRNENSWNPKLLKYSINRQSVPGPSGISALDSISHYMWQTVRIGHVQPDGQFQQVFSSLAPLRPLPWPINHSRQEWQTMIAAPDKLKHP
ncbi:MAG: urea ABC transporter substrate-binding protein [Magnetococcales bacterium]|nr:urea ABC transporter substrate-binding protein [Magnetococcales bacterium]